MTTTIALIDADIAVMQALSIAEHDVEWSPDLHVLASNLAEAREVFQSYIKRVLADLGTKEYALVLSGTRNFRKEINPDYKSNRAGKRKPLGFIKFRKWVHETYKDKVKVNERIEADDYLGILATTPVKGQKRIIVSEDKDFLTVPCHLFRDGKVIEVSQGQADYQHLFQTLTGDATDGYPGCPGVGPATAKKILDANPSWEAVVSAYEKAGKTADDALLNARMARILRASDWDAKTKEPILWNPPTNN